MLVSEEIIHNKLKPVYENKFVSLFTDESKKALVCQTQAPYLSIEVFRSNFLQCSEIIGESNISKFVFDKRSLRAFHQPSMEWYFVVWKQEMYATWGLRQHRKILPAEPWFRTCVEAGRSEIEKKFPDNIFGQLDILYASTLEEALRI